MAAILGGRTERAGKFYFSVPASTVDVSRTSKRKGVEESLGSPVSSMYTPKDCLEEEIKKYIEDIHKKRQKHGNGYYSSVARATGEGSNESPLIHSFERQPINEYETEVNRLPSHAFEPALISNTNWCRTLHNQVAPHATVSADEAAPLETPHDSRTTLKDTLDVSDRKRHFMYTPDDCMKEKMKNYIEDVYKLFDESRSEENCWLHPSPPPARKNGRPMGTINRTFVWADSSGKHKVRVNIGIIALIVEHHLTEEQKQGYVNKSWHLSHLCGNWTCCNWRHMTVESGRTNISRNQCFPKAGHCPHDPPCMKGRKRRLPITLAISNQIRTALESIRDCPRHHYTTSVARFDCGLCGRYACLFLFGDHRICHSLTSISKSQHAVEELELCCKERDGILLAIDYLKQIIADLTREKEASDAVILQRAVAQRKLDQSTFRSQKQSFPHGRMLCVLLN